jgi:hypothetical protein
VTSFGAKEEPRSTRLEPAIERAAIGALHMDDLGAVGEARIVDDDRPALSGNHVLGVVKTQDPEMSERAGGSAAMGRHQRLRGILDHQKTIVVRQCRDRGDVAGNPRIMHRDDRASAGRDRLRDLIRVEIERVGTNVDEDRRCTAQRNCIGARHEGEGRHDDLVAGPEAGEQGRELERRSRRMGEVDARRIQPRGEPCLAAVGERSVAGKMALLQRLADIVELASHHDGLTETNLHHMRDQAGRGHDTMTARSRPRPAGHVRPRAACRRTAVSGTGGKLPISCRQPPPRRRQG